MQKTTLKYFWDQTPWYHKGMKKIYSKDRFNDSPEALHRLKVIQFHNKYGTNTTMDAFKVSKRTIYRWKHMYIDSNKDPNYLIPKSKRPHNVRDMQVHINVINQIKKIRYQYGCIGKRKIKVLLDEFCILNQYPCISISTIGKVIKRYNMISLNKRIYHNPNTKRTYKAKRNRVKYSPKADTHGYVQIDTILRFVNGMRLYIFNAVDIHTKFEFAYGYTSSSTNTSVDFVKKLLKVYPVENGIHTIQTDNGSEYLGKFDMYLQKKRIKHNYIYPRCPRINGCVERANRTLQEDFVYRNEEILCMGIEEFNKKLMDYLVWFNTKRPHQSLDDMSPINYVLKFNPECHMYATRTTPCNGLIPMLNFFNMKKPVRIKIPILTILLISIAGISVFLLSRVFATNQTPIMGTATVLNTSNQIFFTSEVYGANVVISDPDPEEDNRRTISGYAWSEDVGWIKFTGGESPGVFVTYANGQVVGSAYVMNTGNEIKFDSNNSNTVVNVNSGVFSGYVWSEDVGWIDFGTDQVYVADTLPPNNPDEVSVYSDGGKTKEIVVLEGNVYNYSNPHLEWVEPIDPSTESHGYQASGISGYYVYWGPSDTALPTNSGTFQTDNYIDVEVNESGMLYLRIQAVDNHGNIYTNEDQDYTILEYKADDIPPTNVKYITTPSGNFGSVNDMFFSWPSAPGVASEDENGILGWQYSLNDVSSWTGTHESERFDFEYIPYEESTYVHYFEEEKDLANIVVGNNIIYFRSIDNAGNFSVYISGGISYGGQAPTFGSEDSVTVTPNTNTSNEFALSWPSATPKEERTVISYYYMVNTTPPSNYDTLIGNSSLYVPVTATSVSTRMLRGAVKGSNTVYVVAVDDIDGYSPSNFISGTFTLNSTVPDPVLNLSIADTSIREAKLWRASLTWDPPAYKGDGNLSYVVQRSLDGNSWATAGATTGTSFSDTVAESRRYYYRVGVSDGTDASQASPTPSSTVSAMIEGRYTEPPELLSGIIVSNVGTRRATISWVTNRESDTKIAYGLSSGDYFEEEAYNSKQVTDHQIVLHNLQPETTYYFKARWTDKDGNTGESKEVSFRTADAPQVYSTNVDMVGLDYALISFEVFGATKAAIVYGRSLAYTAIEEVNTSPTRSKYSVVLDDLSDGTEYNFRIRLTDADGFIYDSIENNTFRTPPRPQISNVRVQELREVASPTVIFSWDTNTHTNSIVRFREDYEGARERDQIKMEKIKGEHEMEITGLDSETPYIAYIEGVDDYGNRAVSEPVRFTTDVDTRPPKIFNVKIEQDLQGRSIQTERSRSAQFIISWETDEPATSRINYGEGGSGSYTSSSRLDQEYRMKHLVIVSGLSPSKVYSLEVESTDPSGNTGRYGPLVSITPKSANTVLETILGSISDIFNVY